MIRKLLILGLKLTVVAAAIYYLISTGRVDFLQFRMNPGGWIWLASAAALVVAQMVVLQFRLYLLLGAAGIAIPLSRVVRAGLISWFVNAMMLGGLGALSADAVRAGYLMRETEKRTSLFSILFFDRFMGLIALLTFAGVMLATGFLIDGFNERIAALSIEIFYVVLCIACALAVIVLHERTGGTAAIAIAAGASLALGLLMYFLLGRPAGLSWIMLAVIAAALGAIALLRFRAATAFSSSMLKTTQRVISEAIATFLALRGEPAALLAGFACSIASFVLTIFAIYVLAHAIQIGTEPSLLQTLIAAPIAFLTAVLPLPANGIGVGEIAFDAMLAIQQPSGAAPLSGATLYLAFRVLSIAAALVGAIFFLAGRRTKQSGKEDLSTRA